MRPVRRRAGRRAGHRGRRLLRPRRALRSSPPGSVGRIRAALGAELSVRPPCSKHPPSPNWPDGPRNGDAARTAADPRRAPAGAHTPVLRAAAAVVPPAPPGTQLRPTTSRPRCAVRATSTATPLYLALRDLVTRHGRVAAHRPRRGRRRTPPADPAPGRGAARPRPSRTSPRTGWTACSPTPRAPASTSPPTHRCAPGCSPSPPRASTCWCWSSTTPPPTAGHSSRWPATSPPPTPPAPTGGLPQLDAAARAVRRLQPVAAHAPRLRGRPGLRDLAPTGPLDRGARRGAARTHPAHRPPASPGRVRGR